MTSRRRSDFPTEQTFNSKVILDRRWMGSGHAAAADWLPQRGRRISCRMFPKLRLCNTILYPVGCDWIVDTIRHVRCDVSYDDVTVHAPCLNVLCSLLLLRWMDYALAVRVPTAGICISSAPLYNKRKTLLSYSLVSSDGFPLFQVPFFPYTRR